MECIAEIQGALVTTTDEAIISDVLSGKTNAFRELVLRYEPHVTRVVAGHVPHDSIAEVVQNAFVNAFRSLSTFREGGKFGHWLSRIAVRCCYDFWRERKRYQETPVAVLGDDSQQMMDSLLAETSKERFEEAIAQSDAQEILDWAMEQLSAADRMVLTLTALEEYSIAEAADLMGWTKVTTKVRAFRARKKLKDIVEKQYGNEI